MSVKKIPCRIVLAATVVVLLALVAGPAMAASITLGADADTYTRAGKSAGSAADLDVRGFGGGDFEAYIRFDLSGVASAITGATLTLHETGASRNDGITTDRHEVHGLLNLPGNTPQNWDESVDLSPGAEYTNVGGARVDLAQVMNLDAQDGANVTEVVPGTDDVDVTTSGPDLVTFLNGRLADGGLATFIVTIDSTNRGYGFASKENAEPSYQPKLELTTIPEPASLALAMVGLVALGLLRRQK